MLPSTSTPAASRRSSTSWLEPSVWHSASRCVVYMLLHAGCPHATAPCRR